MLLVLTTARNPVHIQMQLPVTCITHLYHAPVARNTLPVNCISLNVVMKSQQLKNNLQIAKANITDDNTPRITNQAKCTMQFDVH